MAMRLLTLTDKFDYVSKNDPTPSDPTIFELRVLSLRTRDKLKDENMEMAEPGADGKMRMSLRLNKSNSLAVLYGLAGWRNMKDQNGEPILFETEKLEINGRKVECVTEELLDRFDSALVQELGAEVIRISTLPPEERKSPAPAAAAASS